MKIFLDSNIFTEHFKGNKKATAFLKGLIGEELYINEVVYSEVAYITIRILSGKPYPDLKKDRKLVGSAGKKFIEMVYPTLNLADFLEIDRDVVGLANKFIQKYGLLPNDALILATCRKYELDALASLDTDFQDACKKEGLALISDVKDLEQ